MIKLTRLPEPKILSDMKMQWGQALNDAISRYGSYEKIPAEEKERLLVHYRHSDIKNLLIESSHGKCAFCECVPTEGGNVEVEHFKPKSLHPNFAFEWTNFLPCCRKCNGAKHNHDTVSEPIVNPYDMDPADYFHFQDIAIKATISAHSAVSTKTIEICGLNSVRLLKPRSELLIALRVFSIDLETAINELRVSPTPRKRANKLRNLNEAIARIEMLAERGQKYSSFCKSFLGNCDSYNEAKQLIADLS